MNGLLLVKMEIHNVVHVNGLLVKIQIHNVVHVNCLLVKLKIHNIVHTCELFACENENT